MSQLFSTTGMGQNKKRKQASYQFTCDVIDELKKLKIPQATAEIACIDFRSVVYEGYHAKHKPYQVAYTLIPTIRKIYKTPV